MDYLVANIIILQQQRMQFQPQLTFNNFYNVLEFVAKARSAQFDTVLKSLLEKKIQLERSIESLFIGLSRLIGDPNIEVFAKLRASISIKDQYICATCPLAKECEFAFQKKTQDKIDFDVNNAVAFLKTFVGSEDGFIQHLLDARHSKVNTLDTTTNNHFIYWSAALRITDTLSTIERENEQNEEFIKLNQAHDLQVESQLTSQGQATKPTETPTNAVRKDRKTRDDDIKPKGESDELYNQLKQFDRPSKSDRSDKFQDREGSKGNKFKFRESNDRDNSLQKDGKEPRATSDNRVKDWNKRIDQEFGGKPRGYENKRNDRDSFQSFEREYSQQREGRDTRERYSNKEGQSSAQRSERYNPDRSNRYNDGDKRERYNSQRSERGGDRQNRDDRSERYQRTERSPDRSNRGERQDRPERQERTERYNRGEKNERYERPERQERSERSERPERTERYERSERSQQREGQQRERYTPEPRENTEGQKQQYNPGNRYPKLDEQSESVQQKQGSSFGKPKYGRGRGASSRKQSDSDDE